MRDTVACIFVCNKLTHDELPVLSNNIVYIVLVTARRPDMVHRGPCGKPNSLQIQSIR